MAAATALPPLRRVSISELDPDQLPVPKIRTDADVEYWKTTQGYQDYGLFLRRLSEAVVGRFLPCPDPQDEGNIAMIRLLDTLDSWIDEIPPLPTPQRFGNLAFRTWGKRVESEAPSLLANLLSSSLHPAIPFLAPYLATSFGSPVRMDYGTGHEVSFALLLLCLTLLRFLQPEPASERELVLHVFVRYLRLCWQLQDVYRLELAGSHGVWGLDDYHFLGYIFGSAQLRDQSEIPVSSILHPPLPPTNLYFMQIMRIHEVKHGPFHEHSSQLYSIATGVISWAKVNSGLFKMYEAEVLGKRVVVQHIPLGGILDWQASATNQGAEEPDDTSPAADHTLVSSTRAPWAAAPGLPTVRPRRQHPENATREVTVPILERQGPIVAARMPLGPTASTSLRYSGVASASIPGPRAHGAARR
ncbi:Phosphotyrosyl phosphatase activator [Obba rivulosa]|uniref:Serine/threonine-protein phosphatase 2A activator n=1 Tax=Obba rivulosa TaxID=1052685 RepID=A0A8E2B1P9_9APHY|nr:Phosphotyrosyl phosphatase activator [Obba rivulosa]